MSFWDFENDLLTSQLVVDSLERFQFVVDLLNVLRVRYLVGGNKIQKVLLDSKDIQQIDYKLESFQAVYNKLTGKQIVFEIPETH